MIQTIRTAAHVAHLDIAYGIGTLTRPSPVDDLRPPPTMEVAQIDGAATLTINCRSLQESDWSAMMTALLCAGWEPLENQDLTLAHVGYDVEMQEVLALTSDDRIVTHPTPAGLRGAMVELMRVARVV